MTLKGFDTMYDEEPEPLPGTYQHTRKVWEQKKREKAQAELVDNCLLINKITPTENVSDTLNGAPPLNVGAPSPVPPALTGPGPLGGAGPLSVAPPVPVPHPVSGVGPLSLKAEPQPYVTQPTSGSPPLTVSPPLSGPGPVRVADGYVRITFNFMFMDRDVLKVIKDMTEAEARIYLYLISKSYGQQKPKNICSTTNSEMAPHIGITHSTAFARGLASLERKGFIGRRYIARKRGEKSQFRVYLPCEIPGFKSTTIIQSVFPPENDQ